jgi:hypothetical protein
VPDFVANLCDVNGRHPVLPTMSSSVVTDVYATTTQLHCVFGTGAIASVGTVTMFAVVSIVATKVLPHASETA